MNEEEREQLKDEIQDTYERILNVSDTSPEKASDYILEEFKKDLDEILEESERIKQIEEYSIRRHQELMIEEYKDEEDEEDGCGTPLGEIENDIDEILSNDSIFFS